MPSMKVHELARDLWPVLINQAGLDVPNRWPRLWRKDPEEHSYDAGLLQELNSALFPGSTASFAKSLKDANPPIPAETLLRAFFKALQPFSMMKRDILEMMAAATARRSDDNIKIRLQLSESEKPLDLLLNRFRDEMEIIEKQTTILSVRKWSNSEAWKIYRIADDFLTDEIDKLPVPPGKQPLADWIAQSRSTRRFEQLPDIWRTGVREVDERLKAIVDLVGEVLAAFRHYAESYPLFRARVDEIAAATGGEVKTTGPTGFDLRELYILESDYWLSAVGRWLLKVNKALAREDATAIRSAMVSQLDALMPNVIQTKVEREEVVKKLTDILNLPVWKQRHAVYAVWIGSQIWQSLKDDWKFRFYLDKDVLSFAFSGVHLATLTRPASDETYEWWTELRTRATNLPSGERSEGIQPDYRIRRPPFSAADSDVLIVEVKQYKKSSTKNFSAALKDYAHACEKARVLLTSYGPISENVLKAVGSIYEARTAVAEHVRPDRKEYCQRLHDQIRAALGPKSPPPATSTPPSKSKSSIARAELRWKGNPSDLDLHLYGTPVEGQASHVYFASRDLPDVAYLVDDIQDGSAPEVLNFRNPVGKYLLCVHHYSNDGLLANCGATVTLYSDEPGDNKIEKFICPPEGNGRWWAVCTIDFSTGASYQINPLNKVVREIMGREFPD